MLKDKAVKIFRRGKLKACKNSPDILIITGIAGLVVGTVCACKATRKIDTILESHNKMIERIHEAKKDPDISEEYSEKDARKDITITYAQTAGKLAKLYFPAVAIDVVSILAILKGKNILNKRYAAMASAYKVVDSQFRRYRDRVIDKYGKDEDFKLRHGIKEVEVRELVKDENGKEKSVKTKKSTIENDDLSAYSDYARFFDASSPYYEKDPENNLIFLRHKQSYFNDKLRVDGRVFLNDVYKELGLPLTKAGQVVGWVYDESNPDIDNYIDFGIYDISKVKARDFVNGYESVILLDFNVDGNVWESM